jgi:hypothetical protein
VDRCRAGRIGPVSVGVGHRPCLEGAAAGVADRVVDSGPGCPPGRDNGGATHSAASSVIPPAIAGGATWPKPSPRRCVTGYCMPWPGWPAADGAAA